MAVGERFLKGLEPISVSGLAERLNVPVQPLERLLVRLKEAKILAPIDQAQQVYVPVRDLGGVTPKDIVESVGAAPFVVPRFSEDVQNNGVSGLFKKAREAVSRILSSKSVTDLLTVSEVREISEEGDQNQPLP